MKQAALYIISVLFIFAIHGKSIDYVLKNLKSTDLSVSRALCSEDENKNENEKSEEEGENDSLKDKLLTTPHLFSTILKDIPSSFFEKNNFYNSEYYKVIYSPPEFA